MEPFIDGKRSSAFLSQICVSTTSSSPLNLWVQLVQFRRSQVWEEGETSGVVGIPLYLQMIFPMCFLFSWSF